jgi:excisionase family DNA binding protein
MGLLTVRDVAERLAICASLVYDLIAARQIAFHRIGKGRGGSIRISETDLNDYLDRCRTDRQEPQRQAPSRKLKHIHV